MDDKMSEELKIILSFQLRRESPVGKPEGEDRINEIGLKAGGVRWTGGPSGKLGIKYFDWPFVWIYCKRVIEQFHCLFMVRTKPSKSKR